MRRIKVRIYFYSLTFFAFGVCIYLALRSRHYEYLPLIGCAYFIRDFIFPVRIFEIDSTTFTLIRLYMGGLFKKVTMIQKASIIEVTNTELGLPDDSMTYFDNDFFIPDIFNISNKGEKSIEMYSIRYLDSGNFERKIKIPLSRDDADMLL